MLDLELGAWELKTLAWFVTCSYKTQLCTKFWFTTIIVTCHVGINSLYGSHMNMFAIPSHPSCIWPASGVTKFFDIWITSRIIVQTSANHTNPLLPCWAINKAVNKEVLHSLCNHTHSYPLLRWQQFVISRYGARVGLTTTIIIHRRYNRCYVMFIRIVI